MHYLSAEDISKSYGITSLFKKLRFNVSKGDKIGLIARNGTGKSSLLKILAGLDTCDEGKIWIHKDVDVILFEQEPTYNPDDTIIDYVFHLNNPVVHAIKKYELAVALGKQEELTAAISVMDELDAWGFDGKVKEILGKLNVHDLDKKMGTLSGGQRKRVSLSRTLVDASYGNRNTLLLMDEPTNHLDVETIEWLESYLTKDNITLILVTHDRYFLDDTCNVIWELENDEIYTYQGDYAKYLEQKAARLENSATNMDKAKSLYKKELEWMRKQPRARTTKSKSRIDNFHDIKEKVSVRTSDLQLTLDMKMNRLGGKVLEMKVVRKAFGDLKVMDGFSHTFARGERVGVVGKNGIGKSTFLNMIMGLEQADSGKINAGDTVVFGYYSQAGLTYKEDVRVIEYVKSFAENFPLAKGGSLSAGQFLELFLFPPDKQFTYLSALSGGEKKRLLLLSILFKNPNFLILDEPTNDLDLPTLEVLEQFLQEYAGCLLIVSHDRYFMDKLVDHLFVFEGDGVVSDFPGNYSEYRIADKQKSQQSKATSTENANSSSIVAPTNTAKAKVGYKEKREFEMLGTEIENLTKEKENLSEKLMQNLAFEDIQAAGNRLHEIQNLLEEKEMRWLELSELID
jgi:ABC transport system ATP-binding/permease protein